MLVDSRQKLKVCLDDIISRVETGINTEHIEALLKANFCKQVGTDLESHSVETSNFDKLTYVPFMSSLYIVYNTA